MEQVQQFRQEFRPVEKLLFVRQLALDSADVPQDIEHSKGKARVLALRKARYAEVDEPYFQAFGVDPMVASNNQEEALIQDPTALPSEPESRSQEKRTVKPRKKSKRHLAIPNDEHHAPKAKSSGVLPVARKLGEGVLRKSAAKLRIQNLRTSGNSLDNYSRVSASICEETNVVIEHDDENATEQPQGHKKVNSPSTTGSSPPASKPLKKRKPSIIPVETSSPEMKRKEQEKGTIVKPLEKDPKTILSMKFPPDATLPSSSELKAKFARFGPIDTSDIRVSWAKSRCRVLFMNKLDAEKALEHALRFEGIFW